jgi:Tfp pilus assembly protein PilZ
MERRGLRIVRSAQPDARNAFRKHLCIDCIVKTEQILSSALLLDLSTDGAFVKCSEVVNPGSEITLILKLPGRGSSTELKFQAEVAHTGRFVQGYDNFAGFGVHFKNLSPDVKLKLKDAVLAAESEPERKYMLF